MEEVRRDMSKQAGKSSFDSDQSGQASDQPEQKSRELPL
jgi:hypothetical protein